MHSNICPDHQSRKIKSASANCALPPPLSSKMLLLMAHHHRLSPEALVTPVSLWDNSHGGRQEGKSASLHENQSTWGPRVAVAVAPGGVDFIQEWIWGPGNARSLFPRTQKIVPTRWAKPRRLRGGNLRLEVSIAKTEGTTLALQATTKSLFSANKRVFIRTWAGGSTNFSHVRQNEEMVKEAPAFSSSSFSAFHLHPCLPVQKCCWQTNVDQV